MRKKIFIIIIIFLFQIAVVALEIENEAAKISISHWDIDNNSLRTDDTIELSEEWNQITFIERKIYPSKNFYSNNDDRYIFLIRSDEKFSVSKATISVDKPLDLILPMKSHVIEHEDGYSWGMDFTLYDKTHEFDGCCNINVALYPGYSSSLFDNFLFPLDTHIFNITIISYFADKENRRIYPQYLNHGLASKIILPKDYVSNSETAKIEFLIYNLSLIDKTGKVKEIDFFKDAMIFGEVNQDIRIEKKAFPLKGEGNELIVPSIQMISDDKNAVYGLRYYFELKRTIEKRMYFYIMLIILLFFPSIKLRYWHPGKKVSKFITFMRNHLLIGYGISILFIPIIGIPPLISLYSLAPIITLPLSYLVYRYIFADKSKKTKKR